jgi:hypothetical protein
MGFTDGHRMYPSVLQQALTVTHLTKGQWPITGKYTSIYMGQQNNNNKQNFNTC